MDGPGILLYGLTIWLFMAGGYFGAYGVFAAFAVALWIINWMIIEL